MRTGTRIPGYELSTIDTALLMGGMLFCRSYFDRPNVVETEVRRLIDQIEARIQQMIKTYGQYIYGKYGFLDAFNLSFDYDQPLRYGRLVPGFGWVDAGYVGIDQGAIIAMIENHRSSLIWRTMCSNSTILHGLRRAGFTGGWLAKTAVHTDKGRLRL